MYKSNGSNIVIYIILIIVVALLAIIAFSALFAFLFYAHTTEVISTGKTIIITTATPTQINVDFHANILFYLSKIDLSLNNYDYRPYHFVKLEIMDAQSNTIVYTLKIDVTLPSRGVTSFSISIPANTLQQYRTYIITLYTDDGYRISTTAGA
jgi:hypothetical protein